MTAADARAPLDTFDIGRVVQLTFAVLRRNFLTFFTLTLLLLAAPIAALILLGGLLGVGFAVASGGGLAGTAVLAAVALPAVFLVLVVAAMTLQAALVHASAGDLNGRRATVAECVRTGLKHWAPLAGIGVLYGLAVLAGMVLLIVPGLIALTMWCVVVPVRVIEGRGVLASFSRGAELTRGVRWSVFGLLAAYFFAEMAVQAAIGAVAGQAVGGVISMLSWMVGATGLAVLYFELRRVHDGVGPEEMAAVFD